MWRHIHVIMCCDRGNFLGVGSLNHRPWGSHSGKVGLYYKCFCPLGSHLTSPISHFFSQIFMLLIYIFGDTYDDRTNPPPHTHPQATTHSPLQQSPHPASDRNHWLGARHSPHLQWGSHDLPWLFWGSEEAMVVVWGSSLKCLVFAWRDVRLREMGLCTSVLANIVKQLSSMSSLEGGSL